MAPVRGAAVKRDPSFEAEREKLRGKYAEINQSVTELEDFLRLGYGVPHIPVDPTTLPHVYAVAMDYRPKGSAGRRLFLVTYHATDPVPPTMSTPSRTITLLTIQELHSP